MKKNRMIPIVLLRNGWIVQSKNFSKYQNLGNPVTSVKRLSEWASDEIIYIDISKDDNYDMRRDDQGYENRSNFLDIKNNLIPVNYNESNQKNNASLFFIILAIVLLIIELILLRIWKI